MVATHYCDQCESGESCFNDHDVNNNDDDVRVGDDTEPSFRVVISFISWDMRRTSSRCFSSDAVIQTEKARNERTVRRATERRRVVLCAPLTTDADGDGFYM